MSVRINVIWTFLYVLWLATILWLSLDPTPPQITDSGLLAWDKFQHAAAYAVMTLLGGLGLRPWVLSARTRWLVSGGIAVVVGIGVEIGQGMMRLGRFADWQDAVANTVGVLGALALVALVRTLRHGRSEGR